MASLRCPVCKADNAPPGGPQCRRCRADLSLLFALEEQRRAALDIARRAAARGAREEFVSAAGRADALRSDDESRRLLALARLLHGDFAGALCEARRVGGRPVGADA